MRSRRRHMIEWSRRLCTGCGLGAIGYAWALCVYVQVTVMQVSIVLCSLSNAYGACLVASCLFNFFSCWQKARCRACTLQKSCSIGIAGGEWTC